MQLAYANPIRYRGYYYDQDTGLYYLNARYYSPELRRFISPDASKTCKWIWRIITLNSLEE